MEQLSPLHRDYQDLRQRTNQHTIHAKGKRLRASPSLMSLFCCREIRTLWGQLMMKKVAFICVVLVCVAVLSAGCLSTSMMSPSISAPSSSKNAVESTPPASTTLVASNPSIKALKPSALTANQLSRRQSYGGPFYSSSKSLTKRYHYPGCFEVANIDAENLIAFNTHVEACAAGYKPCLRCDPPPCGRFILKNV